tara:strand:+ start:538 stop:2028 length:1491 start_codon:yes stop_codon:yes gene_type:complete
MGLGLLLLVSVGKENLYLSGQAEITYFKIVYKRYTNFSIETIPQFFKTEPDFSRKITINISKNADLLNKLYLFIKLPSIPLCKHTILPDGIKKFRWVEKIGFSIIKSINLEIGGILIDKINGEYLNIYNELYLSNGQKRGFNRLIGNIEKLTKLTNGKDSYELQVPLNMWFCNDSGLSLPLISLNHNDIKIHIELENFNKCYQESPSHFIQIKNNFCLFDDQEIICQNFGGNLAIGRFVYFDPTTKRMYYDKVSNDFLIPSEESIKYNIIGKDSQFEVSLLTTSEVSKDESYFKYNFPSLETAYLLANYVYLDNKERWQFTHKELEYLIPLLDIIPEKKFYSTNVSFKLDLINNPVKIIYWRALLLSNYDSNNYYDYSSYPLNLTGNKILVNNCNLYLNSISRENLTEHKFFKNLQIYMNKMSSTEKNILMYSFCLFPEEYQPSGTFNFNRIDDAYLQLTLNKAVNYQNPVLIKGYAIHYNVLRIADGIGSLVFFN